MKILKLLGLLLILAIAQPARSDMITLTGADLYALDGNGVSFPISTPVVSGSSLVFESGGSLNKLLQFDLTGAATISLSIDFTRLACTSSSCIDGPADSDPHFVLGDGSQMLGILFGDNNGGEFLAAKLADDGGNGRARELVSIATGIGYPAIGDSTTLDLLFSLTDTYTAVEATAYGVTASYIWDRSLSLSSLSFLMLGDNDAGERYQVNALSFPGTQVPEPSTLALFGLGLIGLGFARRRA